MNTCFYPCSVNELLNRELFMQIILNCLKLVKNGEAKCASIILDKDDGSHRLPVLVSFTRISDEERRIKSSIPKNAVAHVFIHDAELAKVKNYNAVEAVKDYINFLKILNFANNLLHKII